MNLRGSPQEPADTRGFRVDSFESIAMPVDRADERCTLSRILGGCPQAYLYRDVGTISRLASWFGIFLGDNSRKNDVVGTSYWPQSSGININP